MCRSLVASSWFSEAVLALLVLTAMALGADATPSVEAQYGNVISAILLLCQIGFVVEILIRVWAFAPQPQRFFLHPWNSFDFAVVALSFLPALGGLGLVSRVVRLLRVVRLISVSATLRAFVGGRVHGPAALLSAVLVLLIFGYIMSLAGFYLFAAHLAGWSDLAEGMASVTGLFTLWRPASNEALRQLLSAPVGVGYLGVLYLGACAVVALTLKELQQHRSSLEAHA